MIQKNAPETNGSMQSGMVAFPAAQFETTHDVLCETETSVQLVDWHENTYDKPES